MVAIRTSALLAAITSLVSAQTPPGFTPAAFDNITLGVTYGSNSVMPAGELIPRPETASPPIITAPVTFNPRNADRAILFMIDQDVPRNNSRVTLLHWFIPNILVAGASNGTLRIPTTGGAPYLQPSPPVGDIPHRYVFLLFRQPDNFSIPAGFNISPPASTADRIGFNITDFVAKAGLSAPAAANWITVQNLTGVASATASGGASATRTAGVTTGTASILPYTGGAGNVGYGSLSGLVVAGVAGVVGFML